MRILRGTATIMIFGALVFCLFLPLIGNASADWIPGTTLNGGPEGGNTVYHSEDAVFSYTLSIPAIEDTASVEIYWARMQIDWEASSTNCIDGTEVVILPGTLTFQRTVTIPEPSTAADGLHDVTVTISGKASGDLWSTSHPYPFTINVSTRPTLELSITGNPSGGASPLPVEFTPSVTGGTQPYAYSWSFGDGQTGTSASPTHSYTTAGSYTATLVVTDDLGRTAQATFSVTVYTPISIVASVDKPEVERNLAVQFNSAVTGGSPSYSYLWDFGDGGTSTVASPSHTYTTVGTYPVTLTVTDSETRQQTYHTTITVKPQTPMTSIFGGELMLPILLVLIVVIVVIAAVLVMRRKKSKPGEPPKTE